EEHCAEPADRQVEVLAREAEHLCVGALEGDVAQPLRLGEGAGTLDCRRADVDPEGAARPGRAGGLPGCLPGPASDVQDIIAGSHAAGGAQHLVMAPQFGVVAGEAWALPVNGVRHERLPAVSPWAAAYASRRSASSRGRLSAGACPPSISSGVMPRRARATRRTSAGGSR